MKSSSQTAVIGVSDQHETDRLPFVDPQGKAMGLRIHEDSRVLCVAPVGLPTWVVIVAITPAIVFAGWVIGNRAVVNGIGVMTIVEAIFVFASVLGCIAAAKLIRWIIESKGLFFVLDKESGVLELARLGLRLQQSQITEFTEVRGQHHDGEGSTALTELSVVVRHPDGTLDRYSVVVHDVWHSRAVRDLGERLASFFNVNLTLRKAQ